MKRFGTEGLKMAADLMLAPAVVTLRLPLMAGEARRGETVQRETIMAVTEKAAALVEGAVAAQLSWSASAMRFWPEIMTGRTPSILTGVAVERSVRAALQPARKRVKSNYRRLSKG